MKTKLILLLKSSQAKQDFVHRTLTCTPRVIAPAPLPSQGKLRTYAARAEKEKLISGWNPKRDWKTMATISMKSSVADDIFDRLLNSGTPVRRADLESHL